MSLATAFLMGLVAGARTLTPPAAIAFAAREGRLPLRGTRLALLATPVASAGLAALAVGELVGDKLPNLGSRTTPVQFAGRIASGALCGAVLGLPKSARSGLVAGAAGAAIGTLVSAAARSGLAKRLGANLPAALIEDAAALTSAALLVRGSR